MWSIDSLMKENGCEEIRGAGQAEVRREERGLKGKAVCEVLKDG